MLSTFELLQKYDVPGPRYTSYPTVPIWSEKVSAADYADSLQKTAANDSLSLYFHLPFCENLCHFCGCMQVITKDHSRSKPYVDRLLKEIDLVVAQLSDRQRKVSQIHFGGGTPNFLQPDEMVLLMQKIRQNFVVEPQAEIAIEMHPRTSTVEFCHMLAQQGFNRISLGVQDFDEDVQRLIHRFQTYEMTSQMVDLLRSLGFSHFNFDLIYGLPGQTLAKFKDTLHKTQSLQPNRLAVYSYAHVPWVRPVQRSFKDEHLPSPHLKLQLFQEAYEFFLAHDYLTIGMDHFAKKDDELAVALAQHTIHRNFMGYSTRAEAHQIGFGVSSISYVAGNYFQNQKNLQDYEKTIDNNQLASFRGFLLHADDQLRREVITQLMCQLAVDIEKIEQTYHIDFTHYFKDDIVLLRPFVEDGLLEIAAKKIRVVGQGHLVLRNMAMCFDRYLSEIQKQAKNPVFSRTV